MTSNRLYRTQAMRATTSSGLPCRASPRGIPGYFRFCFRQGRMDTTPMETKIKEASELVEFDVQSLNDLVVRKWYEDKTSQAKKMPDKFRALAPEGAIPVQDLEVTLPVDNRVNHA